MSKILAANKNLLFKDGFFKGKNVLVTGGGSGLGKDIANTYCELGADVVIASRNFEKLNNTAESINDKGYIGKIHPYQLDVRDHNGVINLVESLSKDELFPDIIVNNSAGNFICESKNLSYNGWNSIIDIVLKGTFDITLEFGKKMIENEKEGVFINISTTYAETGSSLVVPSAVAKAGCNNLVKSLASEWGNHGIRLLGVAPGPIYTKGAFDRLDPSGRFRNQLTKSLAIERFGEKKELSNLITFLSSDHANWMTGQIVNIDGGEVVFNSGEFNKFVDPTYMKILSYVNYFNKKGKE